MNWWSTFKFNCLSCILYAAFTPSDDDSFVCPNFTIFIKILGANCKYKLEKNYNCPQNEARNVEISLKFKFWKLRVSKVRWAFFGEITYLTYVNNHRWQYYKGWTIKVCKYTLLHNSYIIRTEWTATSWNFMSYL